MAIIMGKGCIEAIYGLMWWKGQMPMRSGKDQNYKVIVTQPPSHGERGKMTTWCLADAMHDLFEKQTLTLLSWSIYVSIRFMLTTPFTSRGQHVGLLFVCFLSQPVAPIMDASLCRIFYFSTTNSDALSKV